MKESYLTALIKDGKTLKAIEYLSKRDADQLNDEEVDETGKSPFHWAVLKQNIVITKALADKLGDRALNKTDDANRTAVNYASIWGIKP